MSWERDSAISPWDRPRSVRLTCRRSDVLIAAPSMPTIAPISPEARMCSSRCGFPTSALGHSRSFSSVQWMSALLPKLTVTADIPFRQRRARLPTSERLRSQQMLHAHAWCRQTFLEDHAPLPAYAANPRVGGLRRRAENVDMTDLGGSIFLRLPENNMGGETS